MQSARQLPLRTKRPLCVACQRLANGITASANSRHNLSTNIGYETAQSLPADRSHGDSLHEVPTYTDTAERGVPEHEIRVQPPNQHHDQDAGERVGMPFGEAAQGQAQKAPLTTSTRQYQSGERSNPSARRPKELGQRFDGLRVRKQRTSNATIALPRLDPLRPAVRRTLREMRISYAHVQNKDIQDPANDGKDWGWRSKESALAALASSQRSRSVVNATPAPDHLEQQGKAAMAELVRLDVIEFRRHGKVQDLTHNRWRYTKSRADSRQGLSMDPQDCKTRQWTRAIEELEARQQAVKATLSPNSDLQSTGKAATATVVHDHDRENDSQSQDLHAGEEALKELQRLDLEAQAAGVTNLRTLDKGNGLWRYEWSRNDAKAGKSMTLEDRRERQGYRARIELSKRSKIYAAPPGHSPRGIFQSTNDTVEPKEMKANAQSVSRAKQRSAGSADDTTVQAIANLTAKSLVPDMISDIARRIADQVRAQLWQEHQNTRLEQTREQPDHPPTARDIQSQALTSKCSNPLQASEANGHGDSRRNEVPSVPAQNGRPRRNEDTRPAQPSTKAPLKDVRGLQIDKTRGPDKQLSLVEELFPDMPDQDEEAINGHRNVPRLQIKSDRPGSGQTGTVRRVVRSRHDAALEQNRQFEKLGKEPTVLLLRNASTSLIEDDFKRLIPKGKHIEEWQGDGAYIKVIPGRDLRTMERMGHYYIIFATRSSARAYQMNVSRAHKAAQTYTQSSFMSAMPPPPGFLIDGEDMDALKKSFSLMPASQTLQLNLMTPPYSANLKKAILNNELPILTDIPHKHKVLLSIEGSDQRAAEVQKYIHLLGRERGLAYELVEGNGAIKELDLRKRSKDPSSEMEDESVKSADPDDGEADNPEVHIKDSAQEEDLRKFVVSFVSEVEAKRFARASHGRRFPIFTKGALPHERPGKMTAEYLW